MIPGLGGGGLSNQSSASSEAGGTAGSVGDKFQTLGGTVDTSLFSNTGIKFGNKGIDPNAIILGGVAIAALLFLIKR